MKQKLFATAAIWLLSFLASIHVLADEYQTRGEIDCAFGSNIVWNLSDDGTLTLNPHWGGHFDPSSPSYTLYLPGIPNYSEKNNDSPWAGNPVIKKLVIKGDYANDCLDMIGDYAFDGCSNLSEIILEEGRAGLTLLQGKIGKSAFRGCNFSSLKINKEITSIEDYAFAQNRNLKQIEFESGGSNVSIGNYAFMNCNLQRVNLQSVGTIGYWAFADNKNLTHVTLPENIERIEGGTFLRCDLRELQLPEKVTFIGAEAFAGNPHLTTVTLPSKLKKMEDYVFYKCALESIRLPETLTSVGWMAFADNNLKSIHIPASLTEIGSNCFISNHLLQQITVANANTIYTSKDINGTECNALILKRGPNLTHQLGDYRHLMLGCTNTKIPNDIYYIDDNAFNGLDGLTEITIPNSVYGIGRMAFAWCSNLKRVTVMGNHITASNFSTTVFDGCHLEAVILGTFTIPYFTPDCFVQDLISSVTLILPDEKTVKLFKANEVWNNSFKGIQVVGRLARLFAEFDKDKWSMKFHYSDVYENVAKNATIIDDLPENFKMEDIDEHLGKIIGNSLSSQIPNIKSIDFSPSFYNYKPTSCFRMFANCSSIKSYSHLEYINTENVTNMIGMFFDNYALESLDLSSFNTSKVQDFEIMFYRCHALKELELSSFNTSSANNFNQMFYEIPKSCKIYVSDNFTVGTDAKSEKMFGKDTSGADANYVTGRFLKKVGTLEGSPLGAHGDPLAIDNLTLTDGSNLVLTEAVQATKASYSRPMTNHWGTLCLPYDINSATDDTNCRFYGIESIDDVLTLKELTGTIDAGTPVVFCRKSDTGDAVITGSNSGLAAEPTNATEGDRLVGTYQTKVLDAGNYFIAKDAFRRVADTDLIKVAAYRAYIVKADDSAAPAAYNIAVGSETTGIDATDAIDDLNNAQAEYYTIDGRRINGLQRGLNIVKVGKKVRKVLVK